MKRKDSFILHMDELESVDMLTDDKAGQLFKCIIHYVKTGEDCIDDPVVKMAFSFIRRRIDKDSEKYAEICKKRSAAAESKWMQKDAKGCKSIQKDANGCKPMQVTPDIDTDTDTDTDIDIDKHNNNIVPKDNAPYQAVVDYLNKVCGTKYLATTAKTRELIRARHREGRTLDDFKKVIDRKAKEWLNTPQAIYLRPETLFGTKFDGYLNAPEGRHVSAKKTAFSEFHQRDYDYEDMQKALIRRQLGGA